MPSPITIVMRLRSLAHSAARATPFLSPRSPALSPVLFAFLLLPVLAFAADPAPANPNAHETVIAGDYFGAGSNLAPGEAVEGDAFIAGGQVALQMHVGGDAVISGATVAISAPISDDLYATGGSVLLESAVDGNARLAGADVEIAKNGSVAGKATIAARSVHVLGKVGRQLVAFGDTVRIDGQVAGNVNVVARRLEIGPNARINGKLTHRGPADPVIDAGAVIGGGTNHLDFDFGGGFAPFSRLATWTLAIAFTLGLFILGWIAIVMAPLATARGGMMVRQRQFASLGFGLLATLLMPLLIVVLAMTVVGIPVAFVLALGWPLLLIFGYLTGVMSVTDAIAGATPRKLPGNGLRIFVLFLGLVAMLAFCAVPIIGWLLGMLLTLAGVGSLVLHAAGSRADTTRPRAEEEIVFRREPTFRF